MVAPSEPVLARGTSAERVTELSETVSVIPRPGLASQLTVAAILGFSCSGTPITAIWEALALALSKLSAIRTEVLSAHCSPKRHSPSRVITRSTAVAKPRATL